MSLRLEYHQSIALGIANMAARTSPVRKGHVRLAVRKDVDDLVVPVTYRAGRVVVHLQRVDKRPVFYGVSDAESGMRIATIDIPAPGLRQKQAKERAIAIADAANPLLDAADAGSEEAVVALKRLHDRGAP